MKYIDILEKFTANVYNNRHTEDSFTLLFKILKNSNMIFAMHDIKQKKESIDREKLGFLMNDPWFFSDYKRVFSTLNESSLAKLALHYSLEIDNPSLYMFITHYFDQKLNVQAVPKYIRKSITKVIDKNDFESINLVDFFSEFSYLQSNNTKNQDQKKFLENSDFDINQLFEYMDVYEYSTIAFKKFLTIFLDPKYRCEISNSYLVTRLNNILEKENLAFQPKNEVKSGRTKYELISIKKTDHKVPQQLIFAAKGIKPSFGIVDVIDSDINLVTNNDESLIYDRSIQSYLTWLDLEKWWEENNTRTNFTLKNRLLESLDSEPEILFFESYFEIFQNQYKNNLPALVPQVYLAYDPLSAKELPNGKTRIRQRIDFLLIMPNLKRIIIEIDGKHHYANDDGRANVHKYAEMVKTDRALKLRGYDLYRFGGGEFYNSKGDAKLNSKKLVQEFFEMLFNFYKIKKSE